MKSNTTLTILPVGVQLEVGDSWFNLQKQGSSFKVVTPLTVLGVLGTEFSVSVAAGSLETSVDLVEGLLRAEPTEGGEIQLMAACRAWRTCSERPAMRDLHRLDRPTDSHELHSRAQVPRALERAGTSTSLK